MTHKVFFETKYFEPDVPATEEEEAIHRSWIDAYVHIAGPVVSSRGPQRFDECTGEETDAELVERVKVLWSGTGEWVAVNSMDELQ